MIKTVSRALVALATLASGQNTKPGLGFSLTQAGVNEAKNELTPLIFDHLHDLTIPEVDFDGGYLKNLVVNVPAPDVSNINIAFNDSTNGAELTASELTASMDGDFKFKEVITVKGGIKINIKKMSIDFEADMSNQASNPAYENAPFITLSKSIVTLKPDDIDVKLSGGLVSKIANVFVPLVKKTIVPGMIKTVEQKINDAITKKINPWLQANGTQLMIPYLAGVTLDVAQIGSGVTVSPDGYAYEEVNATFFNAEKVAASAFTPATFAVRDPAGKDFQGYLTDYVLNTAFEAGFSTGNTLDITYLLSHYLNLTVTTDTVGKIVPELLTKYGPGKAVGISGTFAKQCFSGFTTDGQNFNGSLAVTIVVDSEVAIQATFDAIDFLGNLYAKEGALYGGLTKSSVGTVADFTTTLGMTADQLQTEVQGFSDKYVSEINAKLAAGIVIPKILGLDVSDVEISSFDGYLGLGFSPTPAFFSQVHQAILFMQKEVASWDEMMNTPLELTFDGENFLFLQE
uniref:Uncharacterized protein n=1 Tax=Strombidium inclinatum TaxID=197538 RepID=A0A7S3MZ80_9SPIT|mmetsp:Transcript_24404/g.37835  ORF Transcript_24404/g.37835 Transcript_24404/m.37835 type:complete len:515 (+) Transcript_24404:31-1575(+)